jgi:hypothetical protein
MRVLIGITGLSRPAQAMLLGGVFLGCATVQAQDRVYSTAPRPPEHIVVQQQPIPAVQPVLVPVAPPGNVNATRSSSPPGPTAGGSPGGATTKPPVIERRALQR